MKNISILIMLCFILGCSNRSDSGSSSYENYPSTAEKTMEQYQSDDEGAEQSRGGAPKGVLAFHKEKEQGGTDTKPISPYEKRKKIIKNAQMTLQVEDYKKSRKNLDGILNQHAAYIANENASNNTHRVENTITIRLAPQKFDLLIAALEGFALNVDHLSVSSKDVSKEFVDVETRLSTKRQVVERYRAILNNAKNIGDIMLVEEKIRVVVEEIEALEARLRFLKDQVGESTVVLTMRQYYDNPKTVRKGFLGRLGRSFVNGWHDLQEFIIGLISGWPFVLIFGAFFWFMLRYIRNVFGRKEEH